MRQRPNYIRMRCEQLAEEREKCHDEYDKQWYNRIISELHWASMANNSPAVWSDCPLGEIDEDRPRTRRAQ